MTCSRRGVADVDLRFEGRDLVREFSVGGLFAVAWNALASGHCVTELGLTAAVSSPPSLSLTLTDSTSPCLSMTLCFHCFWESRAALTEVSHLSTCLSLDSAWRRRELWMPLHVSLTVSCPIRCAILTHLTWSVKRASRSLALLSKCSWICDIARRRDMSPSWKTAKFV